MRLRCVAAVAALIVTGCGGGDEAAGTAGENPVPTATEAAAGGTDAARVGEDPASGTGEDARWTVSDTDVRPEVTRSAVLTAVRTARHEEFDRIVYEFDGPVPGYRVSYIDRPVRQCGSGHVVPFAGDAWLSMTFEPADAHTEEGRPTVEERTRRPDLPNVIELKLICDFEAQVEWVAGVHSPTEYRVLLLRGPDRLVIDVRHPAVRGNPEEESR